MDIKTASLEITMELLSLVEEMGERSEIAWTWTAHGPEPQSPERRQTNVCSQMPGPPTRAW